MERVRMVLMQSWSRPWSVMDPRRLAFYPRLFDRARFGIPDVPRVIGNGPIAGEFTRTGHVQNGFLRPALLVAVEGSHPLVRLAVGLEIGQVPVEVAFRQQGLANRIEDTRLVTAEVVGENEVQ